MRSTASASAAESSIQHLVPLSRQTHDDPRRHLPWHPMILSRSPSTCFLVHLTHSITQSSCLPVLHQRDNRAWLVREGKKSSAARFVGVMSRPSDTIIDSSFSSFHCPSPLCSSCHGPQAATVSCLVSISSSLSPCLKSSVYSKSPVYSSRVLFSSVCTQYQVL
jgi:hypothetical protein